MLGMHLIQVPAILVLKALVPTLKHATRDIEHERLDRIDNDLGTVPFL